MEKIKRTIRDKVIKLRVSEVEITRILEFKNNSTEKSLSNYARKLLLRQPVTVFYRNQTADEFLKEMILLKRELNFLGHNYNQTVHKMHTLERIPEFRNWIQINEQSRNAFLLKVDQITFRLFQIHELWLQG